MSFQRIMEKRGKVIDSKIHESLQSNFDRDEANDIVGYIFRTGGKRVRPLLLLLASESVDGSSEKAMDAAAAVEIIHAATLVFDDLVDKDKLRRGFPTVHAMFNNETAISSGLFLASKGVQLLSNYKNPEVMKMIGSALVDLSKGELLDILADVSASVPEYLTIADLKTASLFSAAAGVGAVLAKAKRDEVNALAAYGRNVGMAFQIRDDMLDFVDGGRPSLDSPNILLSHCLNESREREKFAKLLRKVRKEGTAARPFIKEVKRSGAARATGLLSREYARKAKSSLKDLRRNASRNTLQRFADFVCSRTR